MGRLVAWMDRSWYPEHRDNWDDHLFRERILARARPQDRLLDLGAGAGIVPMMNLRGRVAHVAGVDPDPRVAENPYLDEAAVGSAEAIPFPDARFDGVFSDNVLEHLAEPERVFREVARVLVPGGWFLAKTPNRSHYVAALARATPHRFHQRFNALRGRAAGDTFPTLYRANTRRDVERHARAAGLEVERVELVEGRPEYLRISAPTYFAGWLYERAVNATPRLERFRVLLVAALRKPA